MLSTTFIYKVFAALCYAERETVLKGYYWNCKPRLAKTKLCSPFCMCYDIILSWNHILLKQAACRWDLQKIAVAISIVSLKPVQIVVSSSVTQVPQFAYVWGLFFHLHCKCDFKIESSFCKAQRCCVCKKQISMDGTYVFPHLVFFWNKSHFHWNSLGQTSWVENFSLNT